MIIVFVSSEGKGQNVLMKQSAKSRMEIIEIPDLSQEEVWDFLEFMLKPDMVLRKTKDVINAVKNVTGGRILNLHRIVNALKGKKNLSDECDKIVKAAKKDFSHVGMDTVN